MSFKAQARASCVCRYLCSELLAQSYSVSFVGAAQAMLLLQKKIKQHLFIE